VVKAGKRERLPLAPKETPEPERKGRPAIPTSQKPSATFGDAPSAWMRR
jgi:hypothetical protein